MDLTSLCITVKTTLVKGIMSVKFLMSRFYVSYAIASRLCDVRMFLHMNLNVSFGLYRGLVLLVVGGRSLGLIDAIIFITILMGFLTLVLLYPFSSILLIRVTNFWNLEYFFSMYLQSSLRMEF